MMSFLGTLGLGAIIGVAITAGLILFANRKESTYCPSDATCLTVWEDVNGSPPSDVLKKTSIEKARAWYYAWRRIDILSE